MEKKRIKLPAEPSFMEKVAHAQEWCGEKTVSKTILLVFNYGFGKLFGKLKK